MPISGIDPRMTCRAWVVWDSTGAILASFNVASVSKYATGFYTITFAAPMPHINYEFRGAARRIIGQFNFVIEAPDYVARSTTAIGVLSCNTSSAIDSPMMSMGVFA